MLMMKKALVYKKGDDKKVMKITKMTKMKMKMRMMMRLRMIMTLTVMMMMTKMRIDQYSRMRKIFQILHLSSVFLISTSMSDPLNTMLILL